MGLRKKYVSIGYIFFSYSYLFPSFRHRRTIKNEASKRERERERSMNGIVYIIPKEQWNVTQEEENKATLVLRPGLFPTYNSVLLLTNTGRLLKRIAAVDDDFFSAWCARKRLGMVGASIHTHTHTYLHTERLYTTSSTPLYKLLFFSHFGIFFSYRIVGVVLCVSSGVGVCVYMLTCASSCVVCVSYEMDGIVGQVKRGHLTGSDQRGSKSKG